MAFNLCFIGRRAYFYSHILPAAVAHHRVRGRPVPTVLIDDDNPPVSRHVTSIPRSQIGRYRYAIAFDTWALIAGVLARTRTAYLHHSLVGKGLVFKGRRPYWPLFLSDTVLVPESARISDLPSTFARKAHDTGHLPMDWLELDVPAVAPELATALSRLQAVSNDYFTIVCLFTHGPFGALTSMRDALAEPWCGATRAVRYHGYIPTADRLPSREMLDLGELPSPLAARHADLVLADHGSAALESVALGRRVLCYESPALIALRRRLGSLSELRYLDDRDHVELFRTPQQLRALIAQAISEGRRRPAGTIETESAGGRLLAFIAARGMAD